MHHLFSLSNRSSMLARLKKTACPEARQTLRIRDVGHGLADTETAAQFEGTHVNERQTVSYRP